MPHNLHKREARIIVVGEPVKIYLQKELDLRHSYDHTNEANTEAGGK